MDWLACDFDDLLEIKGRKSMITLRETALIELGGDGTCEFGGLAEAVEISILRAATVSLSRAGWLSLHCG